MFFGFKMLMFSPHGIIFTIIACHTIPFSLATILVFFLLNFSGSKLFFWTSFFGLHNIIREVLFLYIFLHHFKWSQKITISFKFSE